MRISNTFIILYGIICAQGSAVLLSANGLKPKGIRITPTPSLIGTKTTLHCDYELGDATLYYVKWYKGRNEFYRYEPHAVPSQKVFIQNSIDVNLLESDAHKVVLQTISKLNDDQYTCEVATEDPSFLSFLRSIHMNVTEQGFQLKGVRIAPKPVVVGVQISLHCDYELGGETLYSVKWYKGQREFYRFTPTDAPNKILFFVGGLDVNINESDAKKVVLEFASQSNSDNYTCEVTTDAPIFSTKSRTVQINVLDKGDTSKYYDTTELTTGHEFQFNGIRISATFVEVGDNISLHCDYELGSETLYSIKWYKGTREFYRFVPASVPNKKLFPIPGLYVNIQESDARKVTLQSVSKSNSDNYTCEVTIDAPTFSTEIRTVRMDVLDKKNKKNTSLNDDINKFTKESRFQLKGISIAPKPVIVGVQISLHCDYELGAETLYSVKWYKGVEEFYRFTPTSVPNKILFHIGGPDVKIHESDAKKVVLEFASRSNSDNYTCVVATAAPIFSEKSRTVHINVLDKGDTSKYYDTTELTTGHEFQFNGIRISATFVEVGDNISLHCDYELGSKTLYSIKWYKGTREFYRFVPASVPNKKLFPIPGLYVNIQESDARKVTLQSVSKSNSDNYTCEVTIDAPTFSTEIRTVRMDVLDKKNKKNTSLNDDINKFTKEPRFQLKGIRIAPKPVVVGVQISLHCDYELGAETLYSVKWYKGVEEFYRFTPTSVPNKILFHIGGPDVKIHESDAKKVVLEFASRSNSDNYTCVVATAAPIFSEKSRTVHINVLDKGDTSKYYDTTELTTGHEFQFNGIRISATFVVVGANISLHCDYELGSKTLYSIKWYKGTREFYRFVPASVPNKKLFPIPGLYVNIHESDARKVTLQSVSKSNSDNYTCEITIDAPTFSTEIRTVRMDVLGATNLSDNTAASTPTKRNEFKVKGIRISPTPVTVGVKTSLHCDYELGDEPLYSIKWYKSSIEFYRFVPSSVPQQKIFVLPGINVNQIESDAKKVVLQSVNKSNNDNYTCEVMTDAPYFRSEMQSIRLDVVDEASIISSNSDI